MASPASSTNGIAQDKSDKQPDRSDKAMKEKKKLGRLTPALRNELKHALRDSSDWHPKLNDEVARVTGIRNTSIVRSRIYVTSASTMHSLFNILRHGQDTDELPEEENIVSGLDGVMDLNYLTHLVFRCYEQIDPSPVMETTLGKRPSTAEEVEKSRYRVEVAMSPGVQVLKGGSPVQWPEGNELRDENCFVTPLRVIANGVDLNRIERLLQGVISKYGGHTKPDCEEEEKVSD